MNEKIIVLIPAYEPNASMLNLLRELKKHNLKTIIVNDGSDTKYDNIFAEAEKYAKVLKHDVNKGKGLALKTGLKYINETIKSDYTVVTMDCDGQHKVSDAIKICEYSLKNPDKLILGKRLRSNKTPLRSRFGNSVTRFFYRITTGLDVYDTQTGLRAFSKELIPFMLQVEGDRFEYEMNVLLKCASNKINIQEIEIETIYIDNNSHSHFNTIKDSILVYKEIFKFLISSMCSFLIDYLLYSVIVLVSNKLIFSNIIARIISATVNYNINKKIVFNNKDKGFKKVFEYFVLAVIILILNTIILNLFVDYFLINKYVAKIITEIVLLILSWLVQKKIIFYKSEENDESNKV